MKRMFYALLMVFILCILITSCTSIYFELPEDDINSSLNVDTNKEYFTTGAVLSKGNISEGVFYNGYWIYREVQEYRYNYLRADGKIVTSSPTQLARFVKVNAATGVVSSLCLDPVCNHSVGSGCIMICPKGGIPVIQGLVGDNILFTYGIRDEIYGTVNQSYLYNLKTGEANTIFAQNMEGDILTKYSSRYIFGDTYYVVKNILDFSETDYDPADRVPLSFYTPKTVSILCEYDFKKNNIKELFEIPEDYSLCIVSSERFFFSTPENEIYSCYYSGKNMKKEKILDFSPEYVCGTYAYSVDYETYKIVIYDLLNNKKFALQNEVRSTYYTITDAGIIKNDLSVLDEYRRIQSSYDELKEQGITPTAADHDKLCRKVRCSGVTQIWKWRHDGSNPEMIFEIDKSLVNILFATDDYLYGFVYRADPNNNFEEMPYENEGRSYIDLKTGEITPIPYLELIIPDLVEQPGN